MIKINDLIINTHNCQITSQAAPKTVVHIYFTIDEDTKITSLINTSVNILINDVTIFNNIIIKGYYNNVLKQYILYGEEKL